MSGRVRITNDELPNQSPVFKGTSKNLSFDHLILYPSPKGEGQAEFLEVPLIFNSLMPDALTTNDQCDAIAH